MSKQPLVSIIVPMFNGKEYIKRFISSIQAQTYQNWELVIVDDGSDDNSVSVVKAMTTDDSRIKLLERNREPKGSVTCRNIGQKAIEGEFFIHLDSDDFVQTYMIEQRLRFMLEHPEIDYASARAESVKIDSEGNIVHTGRYWGMEPKEDLLTSFLKVHYPFSVWNNIYRTSSFENYYWDERVRIYTDFSYIVPCILSGYKHAFIPDCKTDYLYVIGQNSAMTSCFISQEKYESTKYLFSKTIEQIRTSDSYKKNKKSFKYFFNLQLERVAVSGTNKQIEDFYQYYLSQYSESGNLRVKLLYRLVLSKRKESGYSIKRLRFYIFAFLKPKTLLDICIRKMRG